MRNLEQENKILRRLVRDYATIVTDLMGYMPEDIRGIDNVQRLLKSSNKIIWYLRELDKKDASSLQTSGNRD
jgi:hypothetical protein